MGTLDILFGGGGGGGVDVVIGYSVFCLLFIVVLVLAVIGYSVFMFCLSLLWFRCFGFSSM